LPATVAAAVVAEETAGGHCCRQPMQLLGVSAAAAVDDVSIAEAVFEP